MTVNKTEKLRQQRITGRKYDSRSHVDLFINVEEERDRGGLQLLADFPSGHSQYYIKIHCDPKSIFPFPLIYLH